MTIDISPIPNFVPHHLKTVNLILSVRDVPHALEFYNRAFNAIEVMRLIDSSGKVLHAEMKINDTVIMLEEADESINQSPSLLGGTSVVIQLYVGDVEGFVEEAIKAGCEEIYPIKEQHYGDRAGRLKDPFGHQWIIATHVEDMTPKEIQKRFEELGLKESGH